MTDMPQMLLMKFIQNSPSMLCLLPSVGCLGGDKNLVYDFIDVEGCTAATSHKINYLAFY